MPPSSTRHAAAIRAVLFDKDGTLTDFDKSWEPVNRRIAAFAADGDRRFACHLLDLCGMDPETGRTRADSLFASGSNREIAEALVAAGARFPVDRLAGFIDAATREAAAFAVPVTDLSDLFTRLKAMGLKTGIASSDCEAAIHATAGRFGFAGQLDFVAGYDSGHGAKPRPGMLLAFAAATGVGAHEVAMVGDNRHDMEMARSAGAGLAIAVLTGTGRRETLGPHADAILASVAELPDWLEHDDKSREPVFVRQSCDNKK